MPRGEAGSFIWPAGVRTCSSGAVTIARQQFGLKVKSACGDSTGGTVVAASTKTCSIASRALDGSRADDGVVDRLVDRDDRGGRHLNGGLSAQSSPRAAGQGSSSAARSARCRSPRRSPYGTARRQARRLLPSACAIADSAAAMRATCSGSPRSAAKAAAAGSISRRSSMMSRRKRGGELLGRMPGDARRGRADSSLRAA